ncbi:MAG: ribosome biogenesis GTPase Der [Spirochaetales bacterium]|jgi:GTP-binding protein|nr:ribosome biogenesis GTPase Der [Exilispira sp.]NMC67042.1 ribosome biogenesis GTPase Der [Spirochaetales bacterium]
MQKRNDYYRIVLAGRPNVGKSTIFNIFAKKRVAIEFAKPGTTRDPIEKIVEIGDKKVLLIDTGGFEFESKDPLYTLIGEKAKQCIQNADLVLFIVEKDKIIDEDIAFLRFIKKNSKKYILIINKSEGKYKDLLPTEIYRLGVKTMVPISAIHRDNIDILEDTIIEIMNQDLIESDTCSNQKDNKNKEKLDLINKNCISENFEKDILRLSIVGRPNTGKSTLLNCILNEEKAIVSDIPGTTRDAIETRINYKGQQIILVDTAGIRKKSKIDTDLEYYCIKRSFDAIDNSDIVIHLVESNDLITSQDKKISDYIINKGKGYILALNKIDLLMKDIEKSSESVNIAKINQAYEKLDETINYQFPQISYVKKFFISAKNNFNVDLLLDYCIDLFIRIKLEHKTSQLNKVIEKISEIKPILINSSFLNLLYMVQVKDIPRIYKIFTNKESREIPSYYTQYIINELRKQLNLESIPIRIKYEKRKNKNQE